MEHVKLNRELSKELFENGTYIVKECYMNVFNNFVRLSKRLEGDFKIMFCYISLVDSMSLYTRHACFYYEGQAVDPTMCAIYKDELEGVAKSYIPFKLLTPDEYLSLLSKEYKADLPKSLIPYDNKVRLEMSEKGLIIIG